MTDPGARDRGEEKRPAVIGSNKRRRWLILVVVLAALLIGTPLAWRYRPMSETERKLLGTWLVGGTGEQPLLTLTRGRRAVIVADNGYAKTLGAWHTTDGKLYLAYNLTFPRSWGEVPDYLKNILFRDSEFVLGPIDLEFEGTTRVRWRYRRGGHSIDSRFERVP